MQGVAKATSHDRLLVLLNAFSVPLQLFQLTNFNVETEKVLYNGEMIAFAFLGLLNGLLGAAFVHATSSLVIFIRQVRSWVEERNGRAGNSSGHQLTLHRQADSLVRSTLVNTSFHCSYELCLRSTWPNVALSI